MLALEKESAARQGETVGFEPGGQPGQALMRGIMVHSNYKKAEYEAHLRGFHMLAKQ